MKSSEPLVRRPQAQDCRLRTDTCRDASDTGSFHEQTTNSEYHAAETSHSHNNTLPPDLANMLAVLQFIVIVGHINCSPVFHEHPRPNRLILAQSASGFATASRVAEHTTVSACHFDRYRIALDLARKAFRDASNVVSHLRVTWLGLHDPDGLPLG